MAQFHDSDWWSREFKRMLDEQRPEDSDLEYKDKRSLLSSKRGANISKQVSSFLNSNGGTLIYGVPEDRGSDTTGGAPVPLTESDQIGFQRSEMDKMDKERIEDLITGNIQPKPRPELFQIVELEHEGRIVFIVEIAAGIGDVWQAKDKKYYRRSHYKSEPMEHYEINMVRDRNIGPDLKLVLGLDPHWVKKRVYEDYKMGGNNTITIYVGVRNESNASAEAVLVELGISEGGRAPSAGNRSDRILPSPFRHTGHRTIRNDDTEQEVDWYDLRWPADGLQGRIFRTVSPMYVSEVPFKIENINPNGFDNQGREDPYLKRWLFWQVQAPDMNPKRGKTAIIRVRNGLGVSLEEGDGGFEIVEEPDEA